MTLVWTPTSLHPAKIWTGQELPDPYKEVPLLLVYWRITSNLSSSYHHGRLFINFKIPWCSQYLSKIPVPYSLGSWTIGRISDDETWVEWLFRLQGEPVNLREQHDALEFFNSLVDGLDEALKALGYVPILTKVLGGSFADQKICKDCPHRWLNELY